MFIHNITTNVDESVVNDWLDWMHQTQIPAIMETGKFLSVKLCEVLVKEDLGGVTFAVQLTAETKEKLSSYLTDHSYKFKEAEMKLFNGKFGTFTTELKVISEYNH
ncbi:DUF4286 family protein [Urechidicola croceus]|uniref:DUF4286 domain-containing protein n=1 Tax=Urechidicola croceus TaxID=1850246 RepID=A0A1D8P8N8_9FLAO|nr:DUF4286 family protein [Urechidicola croceus]AOW20942.1 hypothetical protein LPB138_09770 [Urechidicola croceus]